MSELWILLKEFATVATPFAVFWLGLRAAKRKTLLDGINEKLESLDTKVENNQKAIDRKIDDKIEKVEKCLNDAKDECREDIKAVTIQISAFQREVAEKYVVRNEILLMVNDVRNDVRAIRGFK